MTLPFSQTIQALLHLSLWLPLGWFKKHFMQLFSEVAFLGKYAFCRKASSTLGQDSVVPRKGSTGKVVCMSVCK